MGLKDSLVSMMGDFVLMNKNPDFRSKSDIRSVQQISPTTGGDMSSVMAPRRHSLNITVGTGADNVRQRIFSITPEMQERLEKINKRTIKKNAQTSDTESLRQQTDDDTAIAARHRQKPRRCSDPVLMNSESIKKYKSSYCKNAHRKEESEKNSENKSRRKSAKSSETSGSRSRSSSRKHSISNSRKNSATLNLKIDEEECDEHGNCRIVPSPAIRRLGHCNSGSRGSPSSSGTPATPIPEDWEAERSYDEHTKGVSSMHPLAVELDNIEKDNADDQKTKEGRLKLYHKHTKEKENDSGDNSGGSRKTSTSNCKSSINAYPPPAALLTHITRF